MGSARPSRLVAAFRQIRGEVADRSAPVSGGGAGGRPAATVTEGDREPNPPPVEQQSMSTPANAFEIDGRVRD